MVRVIDAASATVLQFVSTFGVWMLAERIGLSAIVTMVVYAITLARSAPGQMAARNRVSSYSVWETAVFVLNVLAFVLMGLQARPILEPALGRERGPRRFALAAAVLVTVIVVRLAWVCAYGAIARLTSRWIDPCRARGRRRTCAATSLIGWCGMRGLVTLADRLRAAGRFSRPRPDRARRLLRRARHARAAGHDAEAAAAPAASRPTARSKREVSRARVAVMQAALDSLDGDGIADAAAAVREQYAAARAVAENPDEPQAATEYDELRLGAIKSQRKALERLREEGTIGDEAYHRIEEEIDWAELDAAPAGRFQPLTT